MANLWLAIFDCKLLFCAVTCMTFNNAISVRFEGRKVLAYLIQLSAI
uniref:Uncharacterized protein n=1 Tax=Anguilla anguilla TaxID=7936 RepID=A0A0E9V8Z9_ANGAN